MTFVVGRPRRARIMRRAPSPAVPAIVALVGGVALCGILLHGPVVMTPDLAHVSAGRRLAQESQPAALAADAAPEAIASLLDSAFTSGFVPATLGQGLPREAALRPESRPPSPAVLAAAAPPDAPAAEPDPEIPLPVPVPRMAEAAADIPFPTPRPPELRALTGREPFRTAGRQMAQQARRAAPPSEPTDNRSFFEKLFGVTPQPAGTALAYAAPETTVIGKARSFAIEAPAPGVGAQTAVYDISSHTVYMPDGTRLEAHSGLGNRLDDPRFVHERMRGPTPPQLYDLEPRAQLFHGVRALRLNPVGGRGVFGRTGLLAHSFMLGPNGDSNGCVSFRDYNAFLQAYLSGGVKRLSVVARRG